jgi:hypothetical protein
VAVDTCDGSIAATRVGGDVPLAIGSHTIVWRAVDRAGNAAETSQTVTIERLRGDLDVDGDVDNQDLEIEIASRDTPAVGSEGASDPRDLNQDGLISLADANALAAICTPQRCMPVLLCPTDMTVSNDLGKAGASVRFGAPALIAASALPVSASPASGSFFPIGTTQVNASATDPASGTGTCSFNVTVRDTEPPHVAAPADVVAEATSAAGAVVADGALGTPIATDNAPGVTVARAGVPAGNQFPLATTTLVYTATDAAGNTATANQRITVRDTTPPTIDIAAPRNVTYALNELVAAAYGCADAVTPHPSCAGPVASGNGIDTGSVGARTFTVNAADDAGNRSSASISYSVAYNVCLLYDPTRAAKSGSTFPIKIQLCNAAGANRSSSTIVVTAMDVTKISDATTSDVIDAGNANPDSNFRYDPTLGGTGGYIFNLKTTGLGTGTYALTFSVPGETGTHQAQFSVK